MFEKLVEVHNIKKELETKLKAQKEEFEKTIAKEKEMLAELGKKEDVLKLEVVAKLKENKEESIVVGDYNVIKQERKTLQITDTDSFLNNIEESKDKLEELGINLEVEMQVSNKKEVLDVAKNYYKIEGVLLPGIEESITEFLTIKNLK